MFISTSLCAFGEQNVQNIVKKCILLQSVESIGWFSSCKLNSVNVVLVKKINLKKSIYCQREPGGLLVCGSQVTDNWPKFLCGKYSVGYYAIVGNYGWKTNSQVEGETREQLVWAQEKSDSEREASPATAMVIVKFLPFFYICHQTHSTITTMWTASFDSQITWITLTAEDLNTSSSRSYH